MNQKTEQEEVIPFIELPVQWQSVNIDIESIAPLRQFNPQESYDVANMTAVISMNIDQERAYRILLSCDVESGTRAFVRTVSSTDDKFDEVQRFKRIPKQDAIDIIPFLDKSGLVGSGETEDQKIEYICKNFKQAVISIPAGSQKIRIHASQKLMPQNNNPREYSLKSFAPLLGFTIAGGQTNLSLVVTFPPSFEGSNLTIDAPAVEQIPGQPVPADVIPPFDGTIGAVRAFAWHWKNDPKVTINYRYQ